MNRSFFQRGGLWVIVQFIFLLAVLVLAILFRGDWSRLWVTAAGAALFVIGSGIGVAGNRALGKNRTAYPKPNETSSLVRHGIYARVRHPLYSAVILVSVGWALIWQSWLALLVALVQIPFFIAKAGREERWLREKFPEYADYAKRMPMIIPWLW